MLPIYEYLCAWVYSLQRRYLPSDAGANGRLKRFFAIRMGMLCEVSIVTTVPFGGL